MKVRICHILNSIGVGGVEKFVVSLVNATDTAHCEVYIVALKKGVSHLLSQIKVPFHFHEITYKFSDEYSLKDLLRHGFDTKFTKKRSFELQQTIDAIAPKLIHAHVLPRELPLIRFMAASCNASLLFTDHELRINPRLRKINKHLLAYALRVLYRKVNVISVGVFPFDYHSQYHLYDSSAYREVINNSVHFMPFIKLSDGFISQKLVFLYISRIAQHKGHYDLIKAWKTIPDRKGLELWLVGPDEMGGAVQEYVKEAITDSSIKFLGVRDDIPQILSQADVGVFPSNREGLPLALLEKMAAGPPVIVSSIPELTAIIKDQCNGLVYDQGNVAELASKIELMASSPELRKQLGEGAQKDIRENYSFDQMLLKYNQAYNVVLNTGNNSLHFFKVQ